MLQKRIQDRHGKGLAFRKRNAFDEKIWFGVAVAAIVAFYRSVQRVAHVIQVALYRPNAVVGPAVVAYQLGKASGGVRPSVPQNVVQRKNAPVVHFYLLGFGGFKLISSPPPVMRLAFLLCILFSRWKQYSAPFQFAQQNPASFRQFYRARHDKQCHGDKKKPPNWAAFLAIKFQLAKAFVPLCNNFKSSVFLNYKV